VGKEFKKRERWGAAPMKAQIAFSPSFSYFFYPSKEEMTPLNFPLQRLTSVKDGVEALGVPHTEVGEILVNGISVDFNYLLKDRDKACILPFSPPVDVTKATLLRPVPLERPSFVVDINVARLGSLLRLMGLDTVYNHAWRDKDIAAISKDEGRIVITRDRSLLKRKIITYGRLIREERPWAQLFEVIKFYNLKSWLFPFSRCSFCNETLRPVQKEDVLDRLEPLTRLFYNEFTECPKCGKVYWSGSHKQRIKERILVMLEKSQQLKAEDDYTSDNMF
jgi:uncharacterized protein with PIN domain